VRAAGFGNVFVRPVDSLQRRDLLTHPVWEFVSNDEPDETNVHPVAELPIDSLENRIVGAEVELANGSRAWALLGNIDVNDARRTRHFLTVSLLVRDEWFHLARYHDLDHEERGPAKLAQALDLALDEVFPIRYDIGEWVSGLAADTVRGTVHAVPPERLSRAELIKLAVCGT
jgi:hypothetical protein